MDRDFHYYGAYYAARTAGFTHGQAHVIASASQFIDDCTEDMAYAWSGGVTSRSIKQHLSVRIVLDDLREIDFRPVLTGVSQMAAWSGHASDEENRHLWVPFHFLPGNSRAAGHACDRHQLREGPLNPSHLICRPNSPLSQAMVKGMVSNYQRVKEYSEELSLHVLGVVLHVLADTFAHQDFAGIPKKEINNTDERTAYFTMDGQWRGLTWKPKVETYTEWPTVDWTVSFGKADPLSVYPPHGKDASYLGHGQTGHLPDTCCIAFAYKPPWSSTHIVRNNPTQYLEAFLTMVHALECARSGKKYQHMSKADLAVFAANHVSQVDLVKQVLAPSSKSPVMKKMDTSGLSKPDPSSEWFRESEKRWRAHLVHAGLQEVWQDELSSDLVAYDETKNKWIDDFTEKKHSPVPKLNQEIARLKKQEQTEEVKRKLVRLEGQLSSQTLIPSWQEVQQVKGELQQIGQQKKGFFQPQGWFESSQREKIRKARGKLHQQSTARIVPARYMREDGFFLFNCAAKLHFQCILENLPRLFVGKKLLELPELTAHMDPHFSAMSDDFMVFKTSLSPLQKKLLMSNRARDDMFLRGRGETTKDPDWRDAAVRILREALVETTSTTHLHLISRVQQDVLSAVGPATALRALNAVCRDNPEFAALPRIGELKNHVTQAKGKMSAWTV